MNMKLKDHLGFKRLGTFITFVSFILTYIYLVVNERRVSDQEAFLEFPLIAALIALITFIFVRGSYWVIDGFRKQKDGINDQQT